MTCYTNTEVTSSLRGGRESVSVVRSVDVEAQMAYNCLDSQRIARFWLYLKDKCSLQLSNSHRALPFYLPLFIPVLSLYTRQEGQMSSQNGSGLTGADDVPFLAIS